MTKTTPDRPQPTPMRRRAVLIIAATATAFGMGWGLWWYIVGSNRVTSTDAYVGGQSAQIMPLISAPVHAVLKRDTDAVHAGDVLVVLDDAATRSAVDQAEAELDRAIRRQLGYDMKNSLLEAQIAARLSDVTRLEAQVTQTDHADAMAKANLASASAALAQAHANQNAARAALAANGALASGVAAMDTPEVASARAKRDQALIAASRAVLRAPISGMVARRRVEVGQRVAAGTALMTVVPVEQLYVDAHLDAAQLRWIKPGQSAELTSDTYGGGVMYHGRVVGRGAGTESSSARIPVRIQLHPAELRANPLAIGTAMTVTVHIGQ